MWCSKVWSRLVKFSFGPVIHGHELCFQGLVQIGQNIIFSLTSLNFQINTILGVLLLLQDDDAEVANLWFTDIKDVISQLVSLEILYRCCIFPNKENVDGFFLPLKPAPFPVGHVVKSTSMDSDINNSSEKNVKMSRSKSTKCEFHHRSVIRDRILKKIKFNVLALSFQAKRAIRRRHHKFRRKEKN